MKNVSVFSPASIANLAVGFDVLGLSFDGLGDVVTASLDSGASDSQESVTISEIVWRKGLGIDDLSFDIPLSTRNNCASVVAEAILKDYDITQKLQLRIEKGIPLGSGMGGSAASSVAAAMSVSELFGLNLSREEIVKYAILGEVLATGAAHPDNVVPSCYGGITISSQLAEGSLKTIQLPLWDDLYVILYYPNLVLNTKDSRSVLNSHVSLSDMVKQNSLLGMFISSIFLKDKNLLSYSLKDIIVEPQRKHLIPGFDALQNCSLDNGALGCSISGSGPTLFSIAPDHETANSISKAMKNMGLRIHGDGVKTFISNLNSRGARIV